MDIFWYVIIGAVVIALVIGGLVLSRRPRSIEQEVRSARLAPTGALETRLTKSRTALGGSLRAVFGRNSLDGSFWDSLEEALVSGDVGIKASSAIVAAVRETAPPDPSSARAALVSEVGATLAGKDRSLHLQGRPAVILVVGVNGTGKTTTIAKLAKHLVEQGQTTLLGAADTFRAAADAQLRTWADRVGVEVVGGQEGADPAAVAFDAYSAARSRGRQVVVIDTAGRLHSKTDLMSELSKIRRVIEREAGRVDEVLLVLDATAGQNAIAQARQFLDTAGVTGIVLSKLDGTAKGGVVVAIEAELGIPVKFVGIGEGMDDLMAFDPDEFVAALLGAV
jgi:fused signal recognition particle receptor